MLKYFRRWEPLLGTGFVFLVFWVVTLLPLDRLEAIDPIGEAFADFRITDMVYSKFRDEGTAPDSNIVLVNIGTVDRATVGYIIRRLNQYGPRVIGIDAFFREEKVPEVDDPLVTALRESRSPVVLVHELYDWDAERRQFQSTRTSHPKFNSLVTNGYANITNDPESPQTIRHISPRQVLTTGKEELSFAVKLAQYYDPGAAQRCLDRNQEQEAINWRGNINTGSFFFIDLDAVMDSTADLSLVRNRIVLMAFIDVSNKSVEDKYFTPVNERYAGKTFPDMYGIVIHANMISMILNGNYISEMTPFWGLVVAAMLCYLLMVFFSYLHYVHPRWFDVSTKGSQLLASTLILGAVLLIFANFRTLIQFNALLLVVVLAPDLLEIYLPMHERYLSKFFTRKTRAHTPAA